MKAIQSKIFIVEDDQFFGTMLKELLLKNNYRKTSLFSSGEECIEHLNEAPDIVILDHDLGSMNGLDVLKRIKEVNPNIQVIYLSAQERLNVAIKSLKYGAYDYLEKSTKSLNRLIMLLNRIRHSKRLARENKGLKRFKTTFLVLYGIGLLTLTYFYLFKPEYL